ncbi:MAG: alpha/beta fold hydrolase [Odoribacter splanchnicus]
MDWNIPDIRSPYQAEILFIKAGHSDYLPEKITEATRYYFPKARQKTIPEATHRIHVDQPLRLAHTLSDYFLAP